MGATKNNKSDVEKAQNFQDEDVATWGEMVTKIFWFLPYVLVAVATGLLMLTIFGVGGDIGPFSPSKSGQNGQNQVSPTFAPSSSPSLAPSSSPSLAPTPRVTRPPLDLSTLPPGPVIIF